jgi:hypothetical protein
MARTIADVETSLQASIARQNPAIDTETGPIPDVFIIPQAVEFASTEQVVEDLGRRYSADYVATLSRNDVRLFGANHGFRFEQGKAPTGFATYYRYARPLAGQVFTVTAGSVVSSDDGSLNYAVTQMQQMRGDSADVYYNATRRRYELTVPIQALGIGPEYAVPAGRIRNMGNQILGFDGVTQLTRITGGAPAQSIPSFMNLVRSRLEGSALGGLAGLESLVREFARGEVDDVSLVFSTDVHNFRRRSRRAAVDVWIIGLRETEQTDTFTADAFNASSFRLTQQPVMAVTNVAVNGTNVPFTFVEDTDDTRRGSIHAESAIHLVNPALVGAVVTVKYSYNALITSIQSYLDGRSTSNQTDSPSFRRRPRLYDLDIRVRAGVAIPVRVVAELTILSSYDEATAASAAVNSVLSEVNTGLFEAQLIPDTVRSAIASRAVGVSSVRIQTFQRTDRAFLQVEAVEFRPFEYPTTSEDYITILVRRG